MPFVPANENHAIIEVVFELGFSRQWSEQELLRVEAAHGQWRTQLPRASKKLNQQLVVGVGNFPAWSPSSGIVFESFQPDGQIAWRLLIENNIAVVNCLAYTRWDQVWPTAHGLFQSALRAAQATDDQHTISATLQYVDGFNWNGPTEDYQVGELLREESDELPRALFTRGGHLWHQYSGWFDDGTQGVAGRTLKRIHFDGIESQETLAHVRCDASLRRDFAQGISVASITQEDDDRIDDTFCDLHLENKTLMRSLLCNRMLEMIGLAQ